MSASRGPAVSVKFRNIADEPAEVFWVSPDGDEQAVLAVEGGENKALESTGGHVMRVRGEFNNILVEVMVGVAPKQVVEIASCGKLSDEVARLEDSDWLQEHGSRDDPALVGCPLPALLSEVRMRGFHVMCATTSPGGALERLCIFKDGLEASPCTTAMRLEGIETVAELSSAAMRLLRPRWRPKRLAPPPAIFTASGRRMPGHLSLSAAGVPAYRRAVVLIEGGAWHWPPIRVGFERPLSFVRSSAGSPVLRTLSLKPRIFEVKSFIEERECDVMLEKARPHVRKSSVSVKDGDHGKPVDSWRTSENYFLDSTGDPDLEALDMRVQNLTRLPIVNSEYAQILKYEKQGRYVAHTDYFDPAAYTKDAQTLRLIGNGAYNRLLTVFMYMSDVPKGGETYFPAYGGRDGPVDFEDCSLGFSVRPERRKVIIFYNMHPDGNLDPHSLHGGCRVVEGTKWSANFWIWNSPQQFKRARVFEDMAASFSEWEEHRDREEEAVVLVLADGAQHSAEL